MRYPVRPTFITCHSAALVRSPNTQAGLHQGPKLPTGGAEGSLRSGGPELGMESFCESSEPPNHLQPKHTTNTSPTGQVFNAMGDEGMSTHGNDISCH